jgi:hypothetical protein
MNKYSTLLSRASRQHLRVMFGGHSQQRACSAKEHFVSHAFNFSRASETPLDTSSGSKCLRQRVVAVWIGETISINGVTRQRNVLLMLFSCTLGTAYGVLHLLAWHVPFSSKAEQMLWRTSGVLVTSFVPVITLASFSFAFLFVCLKGCHGCSARSYRPNATTVWLIVVLEIVLGVFCIFARFYLVLECFISLPYMLAEVYEQPQWSGYIPHIGAG